MAFSSFSASDLGYSNELYYILATGIPDSASDHAVEIQFLKKKNGGCGEVFVHRITKSTALLRFPDMEVAQSILAHKQILGGKCLELVLLDKSKPSLPKRPEMPMWVKSFQRMLLGVNEQRTHNPLDMVLGGKNQDILQFLLKEEIPSDRKFCALLLLGHIRTEHQGHVLCALVTQLQEPLAAGDYSLEDLAKTSRTMPFESALSYLYNECSLCCRYLRRDSIFPLDPFCTCTVCEKCLAQGLTTTIAEQKVRRLSCPACLVSLTDIEFERFIDLILPHMPRLLSGSNLQLFQRNLAEWQVMNNERFRWCAHCEAGFIWADRRLKMTCSCGKSTCFNCKQKWAPQHDDLSCEQYAEWQRNNDPKLQEQGLAVYLRNHGIVCPKCKFRYELSKGACLHFICGRCKHEFCGSCAYPFVKKECTRLSSCQKRGLHCHHPRNCLAVLRDMEVPALQQMLQDNKKAFDTVSRTQNGACAVQIQDDNLKDCTCGKSIEKGHADLCVNHYKEYLVAEIQRHGIDPAHFLKTEDLTILLQSNEIAFPQNANHLQLLKLVWKLPLAQFGATSG